MKKNFFISLFLLFMASSSAFSLSVSVTIIYGGAQSQGCCNICGQDYWCANNPYGCGTNVACYAKAFFDPVPAGNIITGVSVLYYAAGCYASSFPSYINGCYIGAAPVNSQCQCGSCTSYSFSNPSFSCGMPCYNYGGSNSFSICPNGPSCFQRAIITFTYTSSVGLMSFAPSSASASPNPICGGSTTLTVNGGSLGVGANWNWYAGSCGGTFVGSGSSVNVSPTSTTTYFVRAAGTCNTTACASVTVTVANPSIAPSSASASPNPTCGGATTLTQSGGSLGTGAVYNWYSGSCGGTFVGSGSSISVSPSSTTTYFVRAQGNCNTTGCASVTVTVNSFSAAPSSATVSPNPICAGASVTLTENGGTLGVGAVYNWYSGSCGGTLVGSGSSITVTPSTTTTYYVRAQGTCNTTACASITSTVNPIPFATATPAAQSICSGATTSIAINSFTSGTTFSWTVVSQPGISGASSSGGPNINQTLTNSGTSPGTATYTITPVAAGCTGNPITVVITVNPIPVATATPTAQTICSGGTTSIALTSNVSGTTFNWTVVQTGVSGATTNSSTSTLAETIMTLSPNAAGTAVYTITPAANGCLGAPITVTITVNPKPIATATPTSQTICSGSPTSIALTSNVSGATFTWTVAQTGGVTGGLSGLGTNITDVLTTTTPGTAVYTILPTANSCIGNPLQVTITVNPMDDASFSYAATSFCKTGLNPTPTITGLPGGAFSSSPAGLSINAATGTITLSTSTIGTYAVTYTTNGICPNTSNVSVTITSAPLAGFSYSGSPYCQYGSDPSPTFVSGGFGGLFTATPTGLVFVNTNTGVINLLTSTPGTYTVTNYIAASGGCAADSATATVTISVTPIVTATPSSQTICSGTATSIILTSTLPGTSYAWTVSQTNVSGGLPGIGTPIAQTLTANVIGTAVYTIIPTVGLCSGAPISDTVTVNPIPVVTATPTSQAFCSGGTTSIALTGNVTGTTFSWTASSSGVTGATFGFGNNIAQSLFNSGNISGTAIYAITPTANGCLGTALNVTVTVGPRDNSSFVYSSATYCQSGGTATPVITGLPGGTFSSTPSGLTLNPSNGTIILSSSALGTFTLCYATNGTCPDTTCITMTISNTAPLANFSYAGSPFCPNGNDPSPVFGPGASAGIFSATPLGLAFVNVNTGKIDLLASSAGTYVVTNTIPASGNCPAVSATTTVVISALDDASFTYPSATYCHSGPSQTPTITGVPGGTFSSTPAGLTINPTTGVITLSTSAIGSYTLSYHTNGPCPNTSSIVMTIDSLTPSANFTYLGTPFCHNGNNPSPVYGADASAGTFSATPGGLVFVNLNTGEINLTLSLAGTYTVTNYIPASGTCLSASATAIVTISAADDASFVYSSATYCQTGPNETPTITGLPGGTFLSTPPGLSINSSTGTINLAVSTLGTYTVSYTTNGPCPNTSSITMSIIASTNFAGFNYPNPTYCQNGTNPLPVFNPGATAGVFTTNPIGLAFVNINTGEIDLASSTLGSYTVTNTVPASGGCAAVVATTTINITASDDASFVYTSATYCTSGTPQTPAITGLPGGAFSSSPAGLSINPTTGTVTLSTSAVGIYLVSYTTNGSCPNTSTITMTIVSSTPFANFSYLGSPFCQNINNPAPIFGPGASAGIFTSSPGGLTFVHVNTGQIDLSASTPGTYTITNTIPPSGTCGAVSATTTVIITPSDDASFVYSSATYCQTGPNPTPSITGLPGGTFLSIPPGLSINPTTGTINLATSTIGIYTLSYTTNGPCPKTSSIVMTINTTNSFATFSYPGSPFCQNGINPYPTFASGGSAGTFSASPAGIVFIHVNTGQINLSASTPGTYTITNTIPASGGCAAVVATSIVTISASDDAAFTYTSATYCTTGSPQTPTITGLQGGTFSAVPPGLSINPTTGTITLSTSTIGVYTLYYRTHGTCPDTSSITMTITNTTPFANFSYPGSPYCQFGTNPFPSYGPGASAGTFTSSPAGLVFIHVNTGQINLALTAAGTYTVTNTIPVSGNCGAVSATTTVVIGGAPIAIATPSSQNICTGGTTSVNLTSTTAGTTFVWTVVPTSVTGSSAGFGTSISQTLTSTGTGTAVYTITPTANGCPGLPITVSVTVHSLPIIDTSAIIITPAKCGSATGGITGVNMSSGQHPFTYQWKDSLGNIVGGSVDLSNAGKGKYTVIVTDSNGCSITAGPFTILATPPVVAAFTANPITGETPLIVQFTNNSSIEATTYLWQFGTGDTSSAVNPSYVYKPLGNFTVCLIADNGYGCRDTVCDSINVYINSAFIVPNVFTPNGDNFNDIFTLKAIGLKTMDAEIFNRWGEKEYEWHTTNGGWDGRTASGLSAPTGTYYYIINASGIDGKKYFEKGSFSLIRDK